MKKRFTTFGLIALFIVSNYVFCQSGQGLEKLSLDGNWEVIFDDKNLGVIEKWYLKKNYDTHPSKQIISVPSALELTSKDYEGVALYRKQFLIPDDWKDQIIEVHFEAVNYKAELWLNDEVVGFHEGGYTPFTFRIDKLLKMGEENQLVVRVITPIILTDKNIDGLGRQEVPMWRGAINGGIWQSVWLSRKASINLKDVFLEPNIKSKSLKVNLEIFNHKAMPLDASLQIDIFSQDNQLVLTAEKSITLDPGKTNLKQRLLFKNIKPWDINNPYLYTVDKEELV